MSDPDLLALLRNTLAHVEPRMAGLAAELGPESSLVDLGLDSLSIIAMAGHIERVLGISLPDEEVASVFDVGALLDLVKQQLSNSQHGGTSHDLHT